MNVANNALSRKIMQHFMDHGAKRLWKGEVQCVFSDEFRKEAQRIRWMIAQKYDLSDQDRNTFSDQFFTHLIMANRKDPDKPFRNPSISNLHKLCDALGWEFNSLFMDSGTHVNIEDIEPVKQRIIKTVSGTTNQALLAALSSMVDAFAGDEPQGRRKEENGLS